MAFGACLAYLGASAAAAVAFCNEKVQEGPMPPALADQLAGRRDIATGYDIALVDWICCDDEEFRSIAGTPLLPNPRRAGQ